MSGLDAGDDCGDLLVRLVDILLDIVFDLRDVVLLCPATIILRINSSMYSIVTDAVVGEFVGVVVVGVLCEVAEALVANPTLTVAPLVAGALAGSVLKALLPLAAHMENGQGVLVGCGEACRI